jgi:hypothetical protein
VTMNETALAPIEARLESKTEYRLDEAMALAKYLSASKLFPAAKDEYKALALMLAGKEFGWSPVFSLMNLNMTPDGKLIMSSAAMGAQIKASGRYDYDVIQSDNDGAVVDFFKLDYSSSKLDRKLLGRSEFSMEDAKRANLHGKFNYKSYPKNMCFWRAVSNGAKFYCPDVFMTPVYADVEFEHSERGALGVKVNVLADDINAEFTLAPIKPEAAKPKVRLGAKAAEEPKPEIKTLPEPIAEPESSPEAFVEVAKNIGVEPGSHELAPDPKPVVDEETNKNLDAMMEIFEMKLVDRIIALPDSAPTPTNEDCATILAAVEATLGSKPAAKTAWKAVGRIDGPPLKNQIIALARHLASSV